MPTSAKPPVAGTGKQEIETTEDGQPEVETHQEKSQKPTYPPLVFDDLPNVVFANGVEETQQHQGGGTGGGGGGSTPPSEEVTKELGLRGEEWVYEVEKRRLLQLGYDPAELEEMDMLVWVSKRQPTANHDIRSIRITDAGEERPVYIEVKARAGTSREIRMGKDEFRLALSQKDDYWLYWVANVDDAQPDAPVCYPNLAQLIGEEKIALDVATLKLTLPRERLAAKSSEQEQTL